MNRLKRYHVSDTGLSEGEAIGRISVVLDADCESLETRLAKLEAALGRFRDAFVIAVGDNSPFAKCALKEVDAALDTTHHRRTQEDDKDGALRSLVNDILDGAL